MKKIVLALSILFISTAIFAQTSSSSSSAKGTVTNSPVVTVDKTQPIAQPKLDNTTGKPCCKSGTTTTGKSCCSSSTATTKTCTDHAHEGSATTTTTTTTPTHTCTGHTHGDASTTRTTTTTSSSSSTDKKSDN
jgi:hypothetical protein